MEASSPDWLGAARRASQALREMLAARPTIAQRVRETGVRGMGGDRTLEIDEAAEEAVFAELEALYAAGARFTVVSEERGTVDFGGDGTLIVVDPIDGSVNAKRGLPHHALSIAVAEGPTMADVVFGYVQDFGPEEEWVAWRGRARPSTGGHGSMRTCVRSRACSSRPPRRCRADSGRWRAQRGCSSRSRR